MAQRKRILITALTLMLCGAASASAQKQGGVLKVFFFDSPASMSIHEEATIAGQGPMMGVCKRQGADMAGTPAYDA